MENLTDKQQTQSRTLNISKSTFANSKLKWWLIPTLGALVASVALNLFFYFDKTLPTRLSSVEFFPQQEQNFGEKSPTSSSILNETHKIDKEVTSGGVTWVGIKTISYKEQYDTNYELWRIGDNKKFRFIENFPLTTCDNVSWDINESGGIDLHYTTSPCEAFVVNTHIIYDSSGVEKFRITHKSDAGNFTFKQDGQSGYEVSLLVEGTCDEESVQPTSLSPEEILLPKVVFRGVKIKGFRDEKEFTLTKPETISCGQGYAGADAIIDPIIKALIFDEEKITFTLPNNQKMEISLKLEDYAEVKFK